MLTKELRNKKDEELLQLFVQLKGQLLQMRFLHANGELDKPHKIQQIRQMIARILTILNERNVDATKINAVARVVSFHQGGVKQKENDQTDHSADGSNTKHDVTRTDKENAHSNNHHTNLTPDAGNKHSSVKLHPSDSSHHTAPSFATSSKERKNVVHKKTKLTEEEK